MIHTYFENIETKIESAINSAEHRIYVAVAWFTNQELFDSIVKAAERNVNIKLLLLDDILNRNEFGLDFGILVEKGVDVRFANDKSGTMHHKFCIIDDKVITGSYNWTYHANKNDENIVVMDEESIVSKFYEQFNTLFNRYDTITLPYRQLKWTEIKEGDFTEYRREIYREVIDKDDIHKEVKKNKLVSIDKAFKSGSSEELNKANSLPTEVHLRTITDVLISHSQEFSLKLWRESREEHSDFYQVGKWQYYPDSEIHENKYHREYLKGRLKRINQPLEKGLELKIYDSEFISDIKKFWDSKTKIPKDMLQIDLATMYHYHFSTPMHSEKSKQSISAIDVFGIIKKIKDNNVVDRNNVFCNSIYDDEVFYEGWDPKKRGEMIMNSFFVKQ